MDAIAHFGFKNEAAIITPKVAKETGTEPIGNVMIESRHITAENIAVEVISLIFIVSLNLNADFTRCLFYYLAIVGFEYDCGGVVNIDNRHCFHFAVFNYVNLFID